jgi:hypothetical protein
MGNLKVLASIMMGFGVTRPRLSSDLGVLQMIITCHPSRSFPGHSYKLALHPLDGDDSVLGPTFSGSGRHSEELS